jgi:CO/xanthine dehydrogenase Mo-binding subunit
MEVIYLVPLAVVAAVLLVLFALIAVSARRRGRDLKISLAEGEQLRGVVAALQAELAELKNAAAERERAPHGFVPGPVVTADQRAGALEMLRSGADTAAVSAATGLSQAEADLLQEVQKLQDSRSVPGKGR